MSKRKVIGAAGRPGAAYIVALIFLCLLVSVAVSLAASTNLALRQASNHRQVVEARLAADTGLAFALSHLSEVRGQEVVIQNLPNMLTVIQEHLADELEGTGNVLAGSVKYVDFDPEVPGSYEHVYVPPISLPNGSTFCMEMTVLEYSDSDPDIPTKVQLVVTGRQGDVVRLVGMTFSVEVDKTLLHYGIASTLRVIARGNVRVHGSVASSWGRDLRTGVRNKSTYPLDVQLAMGGYISGTLGTTLSEEDFRGDPNYADTDFHNGIRHADPSVDLLAQMEYCAPPVMDLDVEDFDTTPLKDMTAAANVPGPDATNIDIGAYSVRGKKWVGYNGSLDPNDPAYRPKLNNIRIAPGTNCRFENCTFTGITYFEVDETTNSPNSSNQNSVVFKDCVFEGPIITGVPKRMDWRYNCMQFVGDTRFDHSAIQAALGGVTLMAPNYNVNIGGSESGGGGSATGDSDLCGLVIGGCVDMYNALRIRGTVISMCHVVKDDQINVANSVSDSWLGGSGVCGANVGNLDGEDTDIEITPDPNNVMPLGIKKRYLMVPDYDSYFAVE